jgi:ABC-type transport system involved in multi-copper enzyme maturation permease subunit
MKAIIWKEWRENAKYAVLAFLSLSLMLTYLVHERNNRSDENLLDQASSLFLFVPAFFATAMGLLQVGAELRRDQWAFLIHRPVSRTVIFAGKAIAGASLYLLATGLPLLGFWFWLQKPGSVAFPFHWHLMLPSLANILTGLVFYFAGMLTAIRSARWYGSRALGIAAAVVCLFTVVSVPEFIYVLPISLVGIVLTGLAAWGSFLTTGTYLRQPCLAKAALGGTMYFGTGLAAVVVFAIALTIVSELSGDSPAYQYTSYQIDSKGRILRIDMESGIESRRTDLQGRPVPKDVIDGIARNTPLLYETLLSTGDRHVNINYSYSDKNRYFTALRTRDINRANWYYDHEVDRVVGFSSKTRLPIGYIGPSGFSEAGKSAGPRFPQHLRQPSGGRSWNGYIELLQFKDYIYYIDIANTRIFPVYQTKPGETIKGACMIQNQGEIEGVRPTIAVAINDTIRFYSLRGALIFETPLELLGNETSRTSLSILSNGSRYFLYYEHYARSDGQRLFRITELSPQGKMLARHELPPLPYSRPSTPPWQNGLPGLAIPSSLLAAFLSCIYIGNARGIPFAVEAWDSFSEDSTMWFVCLYCLIVALASASVALLVARRCVMSKSETWKWVLGVFALGIPGLLAMLALREWPARITCPSCRKQRIVTHELCEHCGVALPETPLDGTEIFDSSPAEKPVSRLRLAS